MVLQHGNRRRWSNLVFILEPFARLTQSFYGHFSLFEQAGDYILLLEITEDKGLIIADANQAACDIHGYTRKEFLGTPIKDIDRGLDEDQFRTILARLIKNGTIFPQDVLNG